jgi:uncharacterized protein
MTSSDASIATQTAAAAITESTDDLANGLAVAFTRVLRGAGLTVPIGSVLAFTEALAEVGFGQRDSVYWAGRATLVRKPEDIGLYDRAFKVFWDRRQPGPTEEQPPPVKITIAIDSGEDEDKESGDDDAEPNDDPTIQLRFSMAEVLRNKDFAAYDTEELALAHELMSKLRLVGEPRPSRRLVNAKRSGAQPDLRRTVRAAIKAGGEPIKRHHREPGERLRRLVLLLDVSGSMEPYARALLRFVHAAVAGRQRVEAFTIGTRLTRVTRELTSRDPEVQRRLGRSRHGARSDRRDPVRRVGSRQPRGTRRADGPAQPDRPSGRVGQSPQGHARLCPAGPRNGGGAPLC